jgi:ABC-type branched-subunit amino acid transport system ATPase component
MKDPLLRVESLSASYGTARAVMDVSFEVEAGEIFCLLGRTGAGKTSTLRAILGAGITRTGRVLLSGKDLGNDTMERLARRGVAWVPDNRRIFSRLTVEQNLELAGAAAARRGGSRSVKELTRTFPLLGSLLKRKGDQLSGGEQQLVAVARALACRPSVLLLDEPTEGLAPIIVDELVNTIQRLPDEYGVAVVLVEENASVAARLGRRALVLRVGEVAYTGPMSDLANDDDLQRRLLGLAAGS